MGDYRKLQVWQRARTLAHRVRGVVDDLPPRETRIVGDQLLRAVDSIRLNISEGCGLNSDRQFARCLLLSLGSANEVNDQLDALAEYGLLSEADADLPDECRQIRAMIAVLHKRVSGEALPPDEKERKGRRGPRNR